MLKFLYVPIKPILIQLPRDEQIILIESQPPIKSKKIFYFKDKFFTSRLLKKIAIPKQEPYMPDYSKNKSSKDAPKDAAKDDSTGTISG